MLDFRKVFEKFEKSKEHLDLHKNDDIFILKMKSINYIYIHLNFINHQIYSDKFMKIAYVGPLDSQNEIQNHYIHNIQYNRVENPYINEVHCRLTDEDGNKIQFIDEQIMTNIILKFKKVYKET